MRLLEFQGKMLFARHGIPVPNGALWPDRPGEAESFVVKAQTPEGGRARRGGIRVAASPEEASKAAGTLCGSHVGECRVDRVYVEERLDIVRELYLAVALDRDHRCYSILASPDGGVDIESVSAERLLRRPVDPLSGPSADDLRQVVQFLGVTGVTAETATVVIAALHHLVVAEDAQLVEINPLAVTGRGDLVAADAKVVLDANAAFRHPDWRELAVPHEGTELERTISAAGAVPVEVDRGGDIVGVVSGAGLMMATLDMIAEAGGRPRLMVDLGGVVLGGEEGMVAVFRALGGLSSRATFINAYLQTALCDNFARALVAAYSAAPFSGRVVVRLKGRNGDVAREILKPLGFDVHSELEPALAATLAAVRAAG